MLVGIWAAAGGSLGSFWPIWPIITWGAALGIHAGVTAGLSTGPGRLSSGRRLELEERDTAEGEEWGLPRGSAGRRKWVAVAFVDIVGSTGLNDALGDDEWHRVLSEHRALVRAAVSDGGGDEVGTAGDGSLIRFDSPSAAARCAIDIQQTIQALNRSDGFAPEVRIGIHAGEAVEADQDLLGRVVNLASRVADEAGAGEILVTESVADQLDPDLAVDDRGLRSLKGLDRPRHLLAVRWAGGPDPS